jgi:ubiquinone/menaquinone biosynthesis C-methylase UbiE
MGVASHLGIDLTEYDERIRTFIPDYDAMLDAAAAVVKPSARTIVDLGTGTGALAARVLDRVPAAHVVAIDADADILAVAARRLGPRATFVAATFFRVAIPRCDAVVTSFALHHVRTRASKLRLYRRLRRALRPGGRLICVDCLPARSRGLAQAQHAAWRDHLRRSYSSRRADQLLAAWAREDVYVPLEVEGELMSRAGFSADIVWRRGAFAVVMAS